MATADEIRRRADGDVAGLAEEGRALEEWAQGLERKAQTYQALGQRMSELRATGTSADGAVRVTVDSQGVPIEMTVSERAAGPSAGWLSAELMACLRRAQAGLTGQVQELVHEAVPADVDGAAERIVGGYRDRFLGPEERAALQPVPQGPAARRAEGGDEEDGWADQSIMMRPGSGGEHHAGRGVHR